MRRLERLVTRNHIANFDIGIFDDSIQNIIGVLEEFNKPNYKFKCSWAMNYAPSFVRLKRL